MEKLLKGVITTVAGISLLGLTGCSKSNNADVAQYGKDKRITQQEFYKELKSAPASKNVLANLLIYDALKAQYGGKLNSKEVTQEYNNYKERYGSQFDEFLAQNLYTKSSFKRMIQINLLSELAPFNQENKNLDSTFKNAAYKLKNGEYTSTPVKVTNGYEIIKMISHPAKGSFENNRAELTNNLYTKWAANSTVMRNVISQVLKDQNVKITDKDLKSALDQYKGSTKSGLN